MKCRKYIMYACYIIVVFAFCIVFNKGNGYFYGEFFSGKYVDYFLFVNISLIIFGAILGIPNIIDTVRRRGKLIFRSDKLVAVIPTAVYLSVYYTPLTRYLPNVLFNSSTDNLMCILLGYFLTTMFKKSGIRYYMDL